MAYQTRLDELISPEESGALARFVADLSARMTLVSELLTARGTAPSAELAGSIANDLRLLEKQLSAINRPSASAAVASQV